MGSAAGKGALTFEEFMQVREQAARSYVNGDPKPVDDMAARELSATFFPPNGGSTSGAAEVAERYRGDAAAFAPNSESSFEILQSAADNDIAYWVGFQRARVNFHGKDEPVDFDLRVTEICRLENGQWKMVHRHADPLSEPRKP